MLYGELTATQSSVSIAVTVVLIPAGAPRPAAGLFALEAVAPAAPKATRMVDALARAECVPAPTRDAPAGGWPARLHSFDASDSTFSITWW